METITIPVRSNNQEVREYPVPSYWKSTIGTMRFYYALTEEGCFKIVTGDAGRFTQILPTHAVTKYDDLDTEITRQEFMEAHLRAQGIASKYFDKATGLDALPKSLTANAA